MKMGKVIIIGGTPRSGKTTLCNSLIKFGINKISLDNLSEALRDGFRDINISDWTNMKECASKKMQFFESLVKTALSDAEIYNIDTIFDMCDFMPSDIEKIASKCNLHVFYLGYPEFSVNEIKVNIVKYAKPTDWISQVNDEYLETVAKRCHIMNSELSEECEKYNYNFINTKAGDERDTIIGDLHNHIIHLVNN